MGQRQRILEEVCAGEIENPGFSQEEIQAVKASDAEILDKYPADAIKAALAAKLAESASDSSEKAASQTKPRILHFGVAQRVLVAAAAFLLVCVSPVLIRNRGGSSVAENASTAAVQEDVSGVRVKGGYSAATQNAQKLLGIQTSSGPHMYIYKKDGSIATRLSNRETVSEGDVVQVSYNAAGASYGAILSIDGNGCVTQHYPQSGSKSVQLVQGEEIALPQAYQFDDAPDFERFVFITSDSAFTVDRIYSAVSRDISKNQLMLADLSAYLPAGTSVSELVLLKSGDRK